MDIEEIRTFIEVAKCCNFSKAADVLHIVQSTVSNRMKSLEEYMGEQLLIRDKTGIRLTPAGKMFLNYAKQIQTLNENALKDIHMVSTYEDCLNIASVQWIFSYTLESMLTEFSKIHPKIATNLTIAHSEEIIPMLQNQVYDVALISYKIDNANLHSIPFCKTKILFVGAADQYSAYKQGISKEQLRNLPLIYSDIWQNYLSYVSDNFLPESKTFLIHCNMLDSAKKFCKAGIGCCFLPEIMIRNELNEGTLIHIPISGLTIKYMNIYFVYNKKKLNSIALQEWFKMYPELKRQIDKHSKM